MQALFALHSFGMNNGDFRVGDADRTAALDSLSTLASRGYIPLPEFDERSRSAAAAVTRNDVPASAFEGSPGNAYTLNLPAPYGVPSAPQLWTQGISYPVPDAIESPREGRHIRDGFMAITTICVVAAADLSDVEALMLIIPVLAILIYGMKIGPKSWFAPTKKQLQKQEFRRQKQIAAMQTQQMRQQLAIESAQRRAEILGNFEESARIASEATKRFADKANDTTRKFFG
mgnify:CR=1 FL=1